MSAASHDVTSILNEWSRGDQTALDRLVPLVYGQLRRLARLHLKQERPNHTLQPTALVHEAYLRLAKVDQVAWQSRAQFYGVAAKLMRQILVDHARKRQAEKRSGRRTRITLGEVAEMRQPTVDLIALDEALNGLARMDPRKSQVVELRFFGGLSPKETGEVLGVTSKTVMRDWDVAKLWLHRELTS